MFDEKKTAECTSHQISANRHCSDKGKQRADTQALLSNHHKKKIFHRIAKKTFAQTLCLQVRSRNQLKIYRYILL